MHIRAVLPAELPVLQDIERAAGEFFRDIGMAQVAEDEPFEQVSVHPQFARRGLGRELIDHLAGVAMATGVPALTLTTFADVPWNAPYYQRCGFVILSDSEITPGLRVIREYEAAHGLDRWPRVCMRRDVP